jgi:hypothetical protein
MEPGIYHANWKSLEAAALPLKKLPQDAYGYRKLNKVEEAQVHWEKQGHRREIPVFHL